MMRDYRHDIVLVFAIFMVILCSTHAHDDERQAFVDAHNRIRKKMGLPLMCWDEKVAKHSKKFAQERKDDCAMIHSKSGIYGENLAAGGDLNATSAVNRWIAEKDNYDYKTNTCREGKMCGHYTQVVWKTSVRLGCAKVMCTNNPCWWIICNYEPPGNYIDTKPY